MLPATIIERKRDGLELTPQEIQFLIDGYVSNSVPDYQIAAWAMAVCCRGMTYRETAALARCMLNTGDRLDRIATNLRVDKHSTGGLGDKVSLIIAPLMADFGLHVPMISGRGLGITGGTLDKLEAIPGFRCQLSEKEIEVQLKNVGCVIAGASERIAPADRKLYALRDVTGTVPSIPLIVASILSKKAAETLDALILDIKWGTGAFMQTREQAIALAGCLMRTGQEMGIATRALLTDMNQPLGQMVGNACEVNEAMDLLRDHGPADAREVIVALASELLVMTGIASTHQQAAGMVKHRLASGHIWERFQRMVHAQYGRLESGLSLAKAYAFVAGRAGYVGPMDGQKLGQCVIRLGGGRVYAHDKIDPSVGLKMLVRPGENVQVNQPLVTIFASDDSSREQVVAWLDTAISIVDEAPPKQILIESIHESLIEDETK